MNIRILTLCAFLAGTFSSSAEAATAAISQALKKDCRVTMKARSATEKRTWTIYVQQVRTDRGRIQPVALLGHFTFGRVNDPWEYPEVTSSVLSIVDAPEYKIAVYFFNTDVGHLMPHSDGNNQAVNFELKPVEPGVTRMRATYWDREEDRGADIHEIVLTIKCPT